MKWRGLAGLICKAIAYRPMPLLFDVLLALAQGILTGVTVAALGHLVNLRDLNALLLWGGAILLGGISGQARPLLSRKAQQGLRESLGMQLLKAAPCLSYQDFDRREMLTRLERACSVMHGDRVYHLLQIGLNLVTEGARLVAVAVVLTHLSPWLAVPTVTAVGVQVWVDMVRVRRRFNLEQKMRARQRFSGYLEELFRNQAVNAELRVFRAARWVIARWQRTWRCVQAAEAALAYREMRWDAVVQASALAVYVGAFGYGAALFHLGVLTTGGVVALVAGVQAVQNATTGISHELADAQGHCLRLADALEILDQAQSPSANPLVLTAHDAVVMRDVHYRYPGAKRDALRGATLVVRRGRLMALVGENGSGKTTLARVLLGLLSPTSGCVSGDGGAPLRAGAVFQDFVRYDLTLRENVALGDVSRVSMGDAIKEALASGGLSAGSVSQHGLDAYLGRAFDGGKELSVGQWQAVAIARGVFACGDLLVLDEPTSGLDALAEREVFERFAEMARGRFAVIITHRMGAASLATDVAVMQEGRVVERGTHSELVAGGSLYAHMWATQAQWYR